MINIETCKDKQHWIYDDGIIQFCMLDHFRTDHAFAIYSKKLIESIKRTHGEQTKASPEKLQSIV